MKLLKSKVKIILLFSITLALMPVYAQDDQLSKMADKVSQNAGQSSFSGNSFDNEVVTLNDHFFYGIVFDALTMLIIFGFIYFPNYRNKEFMFTFFLFNIIIFIITFVLNKTSISMGAAFGLFAVFSMLRYRTTGISMKEMTYLLIAIALGLINAIGLNLIPLLVFNLIFITYIFLLDHPIVFKQETSKLIIYENIELIKPENHELLLEDLRKRTGFNVHRFSITSVNFLKDSTKITVYYYMKK